MTPQMEPIAMALRASRREPAEFAVFYERHADGLLGYFMSKVGHVEIALDLTAETMARAFLSRKRFRGKTDAEAGAWLYRIAKGQHVDYIRRSVVETKAMARLGLERPVLVDDRESELIELETSKGLTEFVAYSLNRLPLDQRSVIELRFAEGLRYREIATRLEITEEAARARSLRGLKALRVMYEGWPGSAGTAQQGAGAKASPPPSLSAIDAANVGPR